LNASDFRIQPVTDDAGMDQFIRLPYRLHQGDPNWIPPLLLERKESLSPKLNPFFDHADVRFFLAWQGERLVGRISAQVDRSALELHRNATGNFGLLAAENDPALVRALLGAAEEWLKGQGINHVIGPFNLSINEETGMLVEGRDTPPMLMMGHDREYLPGLVEQAGYGKAKDIFAYLYDIQKDMPRSVRALIDRPLPAGLSVRMLDMKRYDADLRAITDVFNTAWTGNWGFVPLNEAEIAHMAKSLKPIINPRLVWIAELNGDPVAFGVCLPNLNEAIFDLGGKLLPFGWAKLLWRLKVKGVKTARVPLMGVKRGLATGLAPVLPFLIIDGMRREALKLGYRQIELSWILEDNMPMRRIIEALGTSRYKTYRLFGKDL
jgi:hypothetical protein